MQRIKIDFDNPGLPKRLDVMENDAQSRFFEAELYQGGKAYSAPSGATYSIMYHGFGPQNEGWYDTINDGAGKRAACTVSGNVVTCEIARQALQVPGHMTVIVCVTASNGYMLKGWPITANVRNDDYNDGEEVEMYFNLSGNVSNSIDQLKKAMAEAEQAKKDIETKAAEALASIPEDYTALDAKVKQLKEDIGKLDESVKKKVEPNKTTFFDYTEETHESSNLFNTKNTVVNSDGLTITIKDGNIKCEGVYSLSYNKSIDTGSTISLPKGEYDVSAWNGSGEFDVDLVSGSEIKRINCNGATHATIKQSSDAIYSIKVRCTPSFSPGSCDIMIVKGLSKPLAYEKWFETYSTFNDASVQKAVLPMYQKFYGKRIATIGDSIMHGDGNDYYGIGDILAERNGMKLADYSEGGATISFRQDKASASDEWSKGQNIQYQATKMLANETEKPCVVLIDGQTNDINYVSGSEEPQQALGTITTSYTSFSSNENFCGGLEKIFSDIKKVWTDVPIIYIRVHKMMSRKVEWQESYGEKAIQICKKWSVKVVDIYSEGGLNTLIKEHKIYTGNNGDYTHPNREGYDKFYIPMIENAMMNIIN